jgi:hypothetical protein
MSDLITETWHFIHAILKKSADNAKPVKTFNIYINVVA